MAHLSGDRWNSSGRCNPDRRQSFSVLVHLLNIFNLIQILMKNIFSYLSLLKFVETFLTRLAVQ